MISFIFKNKEFQNLGKMTGKIRIVFSKIPNVTKWEFALHYKCAENKSGNFRDENTFDIKPEVIYNEIYIYSVRKSYVKKFPIFNKQVVKQQI